MSVVKYEKPSPDLLERSVVAREQIKTQKLMEQVENHELESGIGKMLAAAIVAVDQKERRVRGEDAEPLFMDGIERPL